MEVVAKDAAIKRIQPTISVNRTPTMMAIGAAREAPATSSEMWAAESSAARLKVSEDLNKRNETLSHPVSVHMGLVKARKNAQPSMI